MLILLLVGLGTPACAAADALALSGVIQLGAYASREDGGNDTNDLNLDAFSLGVTAQLNGYTLAELSMLYEEDATDPEVDIAAVMFGQENYPWALQAGQVYLPFGMYRTALVNDVLVLEIAEHRALAAILGYHDYGVTVQTYLFQGDVNHASTSNDTLHNWGARLAWDSEPDDTDMGIGLDYISNMTDSNGIGDYLDDSWDDAVVGYGKNDWLSNRVGAWIVHGYMHVGPVLFTGELLRAESYRDADMESADAALAPVGKAPRAWQVEVAYSTQIHGHEVTFAAAMQQSQDVLFLELPRRRQSLGANVQLNSKTSIGVEVWRDHDYDMIDGGSDAHTSNIGLQLTREF